MALAGRPLEELPATELARLLGEHTRKARLRVLVRDEILHVSEAIDTSLPVDNLLAGYAYPEALAVTSFAALTEQELVAILEVNLDQARLHDLVLAEVVGYKVVGSWPLLRSLTDRAGIEAEVAASETPNAELRFHSWINFDFLTSPMSSIPASAGVRAALLGTIYIMLITMAVAVPLGVGAAIYLEEYATPNALNNLIETNIRNLAGVPSIIYGILGLAIFVRAFGHLTSGAFVGVTDSNGRTIVSAAMTLALLVLPIVIINAQEAIRAVPWSIREASYGLGATRWQTVRRQVLPAALPGILTGTILSLSRAIGETAPLIVVGASAIIFTDPSGPFSKFTALPVQIWQWTARPQDQFRDLAAAAIIVLLVLLLSLNAAAILLRQRVSKRLS
ncbi:MAG: phosphate ABC transporter permease PstA [Anaerolineae bacterium]|nr:phosphate ABC transporter permease PstA [Anaerolineae bacterium]